VFLLLLSSCPVGIILPPPPLPSLPQGSPNDPGSSSAGDAEASSRRGRMPALWWLCRKPRRCCRKARSRVCLFVLAVLPCKCCEDCY
jgi:hypothetical protein